MADILNIYYRHDINVIRVGLQPTDNINYGKDFVAGAFHPAYRQLVESYYFKNALINYFVDSNNIADEITLLANGKNISNISGQGSENKKEIINKLGIDKLNLRQKDLSDFEVEILSKKDEVIDVRNYYR